MTKIQKIAQIIMRLAMDGFYGSLTIKFESGQVVLVRKEETIKL